MNVTLKIAPVDTSFIKMYKSCVRMGIHRQQYAKLETQNDCMSGLFYTDEGSMKTPIPKCRLYWCFCLGWCRNFVGSESGPKQSVKLLQDMVYNTTQYPSPLPPPLPHTVCIYSTVLYVYFGKEGGVGEVREKVEGQQFTRGFENANMTNCITSL